MKLRAKPINFETGGRGIVILNKDNIEELGIHAQDRVIVSKGRKSTIAIVDVTEVFAEPGEVGTNYEINQFFGLRLGDEIEVLPAPAPDSVAFIKQKVKGERMDSAKMDAIVKDVVNKSLSDIELTAFVSALDIHGMSLGEAYNLSMSMYKTGKSLNIKGKIICDKHSIGGIPGDKTSMLAVPIVASTGLKIPKTSSRAITSPAGTADRMEMLAPVSLGVDEIVKIVKKTNGCLVWGGALDLAPADDAFIRIEYPLGIDPLLLPSIMSKKRSVNAKYVVIDIPTGRGAKVKTVGSAHELANKFMELGKMMGMQIACAITFGEQPLGHAIGPSLEAREVLETLAGKGPPDLVQKAAKVTGVLFEMVGANAKSGSSHALKLLKSGKADRKMREIIEAQGGNPKIRPSDLPIGKCRIDITSDQDGRVLWIKNAELAAMAREAGAPRDKSAGIMLYKKMGDSVKKGEKIFTMFSNSSSRLENAMELEHEYHPIIVGRSFEEKMLLDKVPTKFPPKRLFVLER